VTGTITQATADKMGLAASSSAPPPSSGNVVMQRFPIQGQCYYGNTWHAPRGSGRVHEGVDVIAAEGKLLYAVVDGTISKQYWDQPGALAGNGLRVAQDNGTYFTYLHMSAFAPGIEVGTKVLAGDVIGFVGNTGSSATPHLHFEIHPGGGGAVNPYPYMKAIDDCGNTTPQYQSSFA
jgi:murein DD-endopeptidase MepM/ murein hydrolase activator NlpD